MNEKAVFLQITVVWHSLINQIGPSVFALQNKLFERDLVTLTFCRCHEDIVCQLECEVGYVYKVLYSIPLIHKCTHRDDGGVTMHGYVLTSRRNWNSGSQESTHQPCH